MKSLDDVKAEGRAEIERARDRRIGGYAFWVFACLLAWASYSGAKIIVQSWMREVLEAAL